MALRSMTGFARADGSAAGARWTWELRSVNGKGLDIRLRLPPGLERLELPVRERAAKKLTRGSCTFALALHRDGAEGGIRINQAALDAVIAAFDDIAARVHAAPPTLDGILAIRGVLETADGEEDEDTRAKLDAALLADLDKAVDALVAARASEGEAIGRVLDGHLTRIETLAKAAEASPARTVEAIRDRLARQVQDLLDAVPQLDPQRLHQEAVLIATRADIREELDRLFAHVEQARALMAEGGPVGRRLDFLSQEFNRESNTLCSKANDRELTMIGLDLKTVVDQLREQVQNIE
jgi:uncharacterized protein (TIGR00255 family)